MRDAVCQLFGWQPGSENWYQFVEGPQGEDTARLAEHAGLTFLQVPQDWNELVARLDHPGAAIFDFHIYQKSHAVYVEDLRWLLHHWPTVDGMAAGGWPARRRAGPGRRPDSPGAGGRRWWRAARAGGGRPGVMCGLGRGADPPAREGPGRAGRVKGRPGAGGCQAGLAAGSLTMLSSS